MDVKFPLALEHLIAHLGRLPGVGRRTAQRMAFSILGWKEKDLESFADDLAHLHERVKACPRCGNYTEGGECVVCASPRRDQHQICVVEQASQIAIFEQTGYNGLYHVLGGRLSPLSGIGPEELRIKELQERLASEDTAELILATSPDVEGEATANYLAELFRDGKVTITRIASGIPAGADVGYADAATLSRAMGGRRTL
ncbi:MAG: recombination protein RecR [Victivallales bacterium]|nr:recombination protein RecR [Victivallales bacterium]